MFCFLIVLVLTILTIIYTICYYSQGYVKTISKLNASLHTCGKMHNVLCCDCACFLIRKIFHLKTIDLYWYEDLNSNEYLNMRCYHNHSFYHSKRSILNRSYDFHSNYLISCFCAVIHFVNNNIVYDHISTYFFKLLDKRFVRRTMEKMELLTIY